MAKAKISHKERRPLLDMLQSFQTVYLGWNKPVLHAATDYLIGKYLVGQDWNLSRCIVVLPGSLAGRRLATLLAQRAQSIQCILQPPEIITVGKLPELLYSAKLPFATDLEQTLAWTKVLRSADEELLRPLLIELPDRDEVRPWIDLAKMLSTLHRELASDLVDFLDVTPEMKDPREKVRWEILSQLQTRYLAELHEAGLWDLQTARRFAIDQHEVSSDREILLVGTADLNRAQRRFLNAVSDRVQVLVGAPKTYEGGFHSDGTLIPEYWQNLEIPISEAQLHVRPTPADAAKELAIQFSLLGDQFSVSEVTVGIPDPAIVPVLQETLSDFGVSLRYGPGESISQSPPMKLLDILVEYVATGSIEAFNRLVRIPTVERWLTCQPEIYEHLTNSRKFSSLLVALDRYQETTLIRTVLQLEWPEVDGRELFVATVQCIDEWLAPIRVSKLTLENWAEPLRGVLRTAYSQLEIDPVETLGHTYLRSSHQINDILDRLLSLPSNLDVEVTLSEAFTWLRGQLDSLQIPPIHQGNEIEMLGWLDLALDDAPVLMLTGLSDGIVPEAVNGDAFLPNQLRTQLGLMDNNRRFARDCYALLTMLHTRERMEMMLHQLSVDGDPLTPSRLLLSVSPEALAGRVRWLLQSNTKDEFELESTAWKPRSGQTNIPIPLPVVDAPIEDMAVTDFKKYDQCPYRFYLGRIQKARAFEHERLELDGGGFGDLVHKCVEGIFGKEIATSSDPDAIESFLTEELKRLAKIQFGVQRPPALVIQLEQAERRLKEFAKHQAAWAAKGWRIRWIEHTVEKKDRIALKALNGREMLVHGRIDRIDYNDELDQYAVLDYKTGDQTDKPRANHLKNKTIWIDWQLPLYGMLIRTLGITDLSKVLFGYILLPKNPADTQFVMADFTLEEHADALKSASEIATRVLDGTFWPPKYKGIHKLDDYNSITQQFVARRWDRSLAEQELMTDVQEPVASAGAIISSEAEVASDAALPSHKQISLQPSVLKMQNQSRSPGEVRTERPGDPLPVKIQLETHKAIGKAPNDWFSSKMILASAGTGKTFNLASRALRLLFSDQTLDSILATTFTRKAAGEILHRVLMWLAKAVDDPASFQQLQMVLEPLVITPDTVRYQLARLCSHLHRFRVSTLDSFYSQLARSFALELNLPPGWSLADPFQYEQLKQEAISRMFESMSHSSLRSLVSLLSKGEATRSIRREIDGVVSSGYDLFRRTSAEAWESLEVPNAPTDKETLDALTLFRQSNVKDSRYAKSRDTTITLWEAEEWSSFLGQTLVKRSGDSDPKFYRAELGSDIVGALRVLANKAISAEFASRRAQNKAAYELLTGYHQQLKLVKLRHRAVTFDDISERLAHWMQSILLDAESRQASEQQSSIEGGSSAKTTPHEGQKDGDLHAPTLTGIAYRMDCPIDHLLLDEFQDTSPTQWEIVKPFAEAIVANQANRTSFFCVGDTKQAIYGWRGGVSEIFESVGEQIHNVRKEQLVKSYRSSQTVIDFVNAVFTQLDRHDAFNADSDEGESGDGAAILEWVSRNFQPHETSKSDMVGYVELRNADVERAMDRTDENDTDVFLEEVVDRIADLHRDAPHVEIGVLSRTNQDIGAIIHLLRERGIEASQEGGNPLTDSSAVLLVQSAMRVANHPADSLAYFHVMNSPLRRHFDASALATSQSMSAQLRTWIDAFGFGETLSKMAHTLAPECNARDQDRMRQLIQLGFRFDGLGVNNIYSFIEFVDQQKVAIPGSSKIRVMTIHQSKGLEFDAVFLPSLDQSIVSRAPAFVPMYGDRTKPPIGVSRYISQSLHKYLDTAWQAAFQEYSNQQLAEALCLFYVALTRAKKALYLYSTPSKSAKKTWGSVLQSIFATQEQRNSSGILIHSWGAAAWYQCDAPAREDGASPEKATRSATSEFEAKQSRRMPRIELRNPPGNARMLTALRPSQHKTLPDKIPLSSQWESHDPISSVIGKLVHRWFEEVKGWIDDYVLDKKKLRAIAETSLTQEELKHIRLNEWLDRFAEFCSRPGTRSVLSRNRYDRWPNDPPLHLQVSNERRLLQIMDESLLRGIVDRCVLGIQGGRVVRAEIIDFKTDQRPGKHDVSTWVQNRRDFHYPQLATYRRAIADQYQLTLEQVQCTLLLLSEDIVVDLS